MMGGMSEGDPQVERPQASRPKDRRAFGFGLLLLIAMGLALVRALRGPSVPDRILAGNMFGTTTVLLIAVISFEIGSRDLVDIAMIYALISFMGTIAALRFIEIEALRKKPEESR